MASDGSDSDDLPESLSNNTQKEKALHESNAIKITRKIQQTAIKDKRRRINDLLVRQKKKIIDEVPEFTDEMLQAAQEFVIESKSEGIKGSHTRILDRPTKKVKEYRFGNIKIMPLTRKTLRPISSSIKEFQASALSRTKRSATLGKKNYGPAPFFNR